MNGKKRSCGRSKTADGLNAAVPSKRRRGRSIASCARAGCLQSKAGDAFCLFKAEDIGRRDVEDAAEIGKRVERRKFISAQIVRDGRGGDAEKFGEVGLRVAALADTFAQTQMDIV